MDISKNEFLKLKSPQDLIDLAGKKGIDLSKIYEKIEYEKELLLLQEELVNFQKWVEKNKMRVVILFEGRDAAGKGGSIKRFMEYLNPRSSRIVALTKPTEIERGQWYFRRYIRKLPNPGEIVCFDRSWYNRAVVEPVMGFCTQDQYLEFMQQVPEFEHLLYEDNVKVIKFWFSITKEEQQKRFESRIRNPLKSWKYSEVDQKAQDLWEIFSHHAQEMFSRTHTVYCPWIIVKTNDKKEARLESIRYVLSQFEYDRKGESGAMMLTEPNVAMRYHRSVGH
jgi:polyphosphate kinase 2